MMRKTRLIHSLTADVWQVVNDVKKTCIYYVCAGVVKWNRNGEIDKQNVIYSSDKINDVLQFWEKREYNKGVQYE